jgi:glucosamine-6-phosphate deaminase
MAVNFLGKRSIEMKILANREEMGKIAAQEVAAGINRFLKQKGEVNIVFAAAPSQNEFLAHLAKNKKIDWSKVTCFHLDEYVDLPRHHPNTFEVYLKEHIFNYVQPRRIYFFKALKGEPEKIAQEYGRYLTKHGIDMACLGIGENGHIAFCEPGSDFQDPQLIRIITLDDRSIRQQYKDYQNHPNPQARYPSLEAVPRRAFTMTIPAILQAKEIYTIVPGPQKAQAVKKMWEGPISSACPASALRLHPMVKIYLDKDSASALKR